jgi:hypothetical protein
LYYFGNLRTFVRNSGFWKIIKADGALLYPYNIVLSIGLAFGEFLKLRKEQNYSFLVSTFYGLLRIPKV